MCVCHVPGAWAEGRVPRGGAQAALHLAKKHGCLCLGICNTVGSSIARETDGGVYLHAGPEIGVASTKAFSAQVLTLTMVALKLAGENQTISPADLKAKLRSVASIPAMLRRVLEAAKEQTLAMARTYRYASNFLYLGRGFNFPVVRVLPASLPARRRPCMERDLAYEIACALRFQPVPPPSSHTRRRSRGR